jgi:hypothetical protein
MSPLASHRTWAPEGERTRWSLDVPPGEHLLRISTEAVVVRSLEAAPRFGWNRAEAADQPSAG